MPKHRRDSGSSSSEGASSKHPRTEDYKPYEENLKNLEQRIEATEKKVDGFYRQYKSTLTQLQKEFHQLERYQITFPNKIEFLKAEIALLLKETNDLNEKRSTYFEEIKDANETIIRINSQAAKEGQCAQPDTSFQYDVIFYNESELEQLKAQYKLNEKAFKKRCEEYKKEDSQYEAPAFPELNAEKSPSASLESTSLSAGSSQSGTNSLSTQPLSSSSF